MARCQKGAHFVIVGSGMVGGIGARTLREVGFDGPIKMIGDGLECRSGVRRSRRPTCAAKRTCPAGSWCRRIGTARTVRSLSATAAIPPSRKRLRITHHPGGSTTSNRARRPTSPRACASSRSPWRRAMRHERTSGR